VFRVQGSGFRVQCSVFRVRGSGFRVQGAGSRDQDSGLSVTLKISNLEFRVCGLVLRIQAVGLGFEI